MFLFMNLYICTCTFIKCTKDNHRVFLRWLMPNWLLNGSSYFLTLLRHLTLYRASLLNALFLDLLALNLASTRECVNENSHVLGRLLRSHSKSIRIPNPSMLPKKVNNQQRRPTLGIKTSFLKSLTQRSTWSFTINGRCYLKPHGGFTIKVTKLRNIYWSNKLQQIKHFCVIATV